MQINLTDREIYKILKEKFGEGVFRLFLNENEKGREKRTGKPLYMDKVAPASNSIVVSIGEDTTIVPL